MPLRLTKYKIRIRMSGDQYDLISVAAKISEKSIKEFIVCAAYSKALEVLGKHDVHKLTSALKTN